MNLVCTGALTNIALLLMIFPEVASSIEQIVLMGGAIGSGNTNPCAEFNMQAIFPTNLQQEMSLYGII